jgi:hypothetical protein
MAPLFFGLACGAEPSQKHARDWEVMGSAMIASRRNCPAPGPEKFNLYSILSLFYARWSYALNKA